MGRFRFPKELTEKLELGIFTSLDDELMPGDPDDIKRRPYANFVQVDWHRLNRGDFRFEDAVNLYTEIRDGIEDVINSIPEDLFPIEAVLHPSGPRIRRYLKPWQNIDTNYVFFVLSSDEKELLDRLKTPALSELCEEMGIYYVVKQDNAILYDVINNTSYVIKCETYFGSADDAALYLEYYVKLKDDFYGNVLTTRSWPGQRFRKLLF